jgi:hypothetical protein
MDDARANSIETSPESLRRQLQAAAVVAAYIHEISDRHTPRQPENRIAEENR